MSTTEAARRRTGVERPGAERDERGVLDQSSAVGSPLDRRKNGRGRAGITEQSEAQKVGVLGVAALRHLIAPAYRIELVLLRLARVVQQARRDQHRQMHLRVMTAEGPGPLRDFQRMAEVAVAAVVMPLERTRPLEITLKAPRIPEHRVEEMLQRPPQALPETSCPRDEIPVPDPGVGHRVEGVEARLGPFQLHQPRDADRPQGAGRPAEPADRHQAANRQPAVRMPAQPFHPQHRLLMEDDRHVEQVARVEGQTLDRVVRGTGGAIAVAALTTMVGFGGLMFAAHGGMKSFGGIMMLAARGQWSPEIKPARR